MEFFSLEQIEALDRIAKENHATSAHLVLLAVDAFIAEAARHDGWLPLPENLTQSREVAKGQDVQ